MKKTILKISLTCLIIRVVLFCTTFGAVCAESTTTTQTLQQVMQNGNVYDLMSYVSRKYASFPDSWGGSPITGWSYDAYAQWLEGKGLSSQLQETVTITEGASGGRSYNIPQDLRESMVQYVQETYIEQNPLSYTQCYIYSYNFLNPDQFGNSQLFSSVKEVLRQNNGYSFFLSSSGPNASIKNMYLVTVDKSKYELNFIGTTTAGGFTNVTLEHNWAIINNFPENTDGVDIRFFQLPNGTLGAPAKTYSQAAANAGYNSTWVPSISTVKNTSSAFVSSNGSAQTNVFTNLPKNELVYVFNTLNAYKNYNAGYGQQYYLPTGSTIEVPYNDPFTDDDLYRAGNYYNNIVDNSQSGWTAEQVLSLVDKILGAGSYSGSNNAGTNDDDSFSLGFLGKIGEVITAVTGSITPVSDLVEDGIKNFLEDVFGWLPSEIVALWIAGITFAVFFGILRVIRG